MTLLKYEGRLVGMRPKLLVCGKLDLTHRPLPSRVDLLKVADSRRPYSLVTAVRYLNFLSQFVWSVRIGMS